MMAIRQLIRAAAGQQQAQKNQRKGKDAQEKAWRSHIAPVPAYSATSDKSQYAHVSTVQVQIGRENHPCQINHCGNASRRRRKSP